MVIHLISISFSYVRPSFFLQDGLPGGLTGPEGGNSMMMMMVAWMVMAFVLYLMRPQSMRPRWVI